MRIRELSASVLNKSTHLLAEVEPNDSIVFHNIETILLLEAKFNAIFDELKQLSNEFKYDQTESMVIGSAVFELLEQINESRIIKYHSVQQNDLVETETIDLELENIIHSILLSMQSIYKKYAAAQAETLYETHENKIQESVDEMTESNLKHSDESIEENHLKSKINSELIADLEILNVAKVTTKLKNILLTIQHGKCGEVLKTSQKVIGILPILEQYHLFCKFYLIQQIGAHKISTKMMYVMLTVFVELGAKVWF